MAIEDSDPERRNLMVTSLAFILFYLGEAEMASDAITLQVLPVTFHNVEAITVFAWVMLLWFFVRYWQTHRRSFRDHYESHNREFNNKKYAELYLKSALNLHPVSQNNSRGFASPGVYLNENKQFTIRFTFTENGRKNADGSISMETSTHKVVVVEGIHGAFCRFMYFVTFAFETPGFTSYAMPYILFMMAILIPALKSHNFIF